MTTIFVAEKSHRDDSSAVLRRRDGVAVFRRNRNQRPKAERRSAMWKEFVTAQPEGLQAGKKG